jgi:hypothetical protein
MRSGEIQFNPANLRLVQHKHIVYKHRVLVPQLNQPLVFHASELVDPEPRLHSSQLGIPGK